jgi:hypothetical protein
MTDRREATHRYWCARDTTPPTCAVAILSFVTTAPAAGPASEEVPFAGASPAVLRAALTPEDAAVFDLQWREAMAVAIETLDLAGVHAVLEAWRPVAWLTSARGVAGYRRILARAEQTLESGGELPPGAVPLDVVRLRIAERPA